jgi:hypothetical protein
MWADMLGLLPAAIPRLPRDVIAYDWYYYPFARLPRIELHNFAEVDLATPLQARGIEYWGCPMNGAFRYEPLPVFSERMANIVSWWKRCHRVGAGGLLVTSWESNRLATELAAVVDAAAADLWLDPEVTNPREMLARGFARVFGNAEAGRLDLPAEALREGRVLNAPRHAEGRVRRVKDNPPYPPEARRWAQAALAADAVPFSGYYRWQINDRWDVVCTREPLAAYENEARVLQGLCRAGSPDPALQHSGSRDTGILGTPPALSASLDFRLYLARRDIFVRQAAEAVFQMRRSSGASLRVARRGQETPPHNSRVTDCRAGSPDPAIGRHSRILATFSSLRAEAAVFASAIRAGRSAARIMWRRSRDPRARGPNELMLERDADRLRDWRLWLTRASRHPEIIWRATPVCGAWQLQFTVHNFAPALQKVVVEEQQPDGSWTLSQGLHLIEFRAFAAHPRARIKREFSVPIAEALGVLVAPVGRQRRLPSLSPSIESAGCGDPALQASAGGFPCLRLAVRGVGQVAISRVQLTNGVVRLHPVGWPTTRRKILGQPAPRRGVPDLDWTENRDGIGVRFP